MIRSISGLSKKRNASDDNKHAQVSEVEIVFKVPPQTLESYHNERTRALAFRRYKNTVARTPKTPSFSSLEELQLHDPVLARHHLHQAAQDIAFEQACSASDKRKYIQLKEQARIDVMMEEFWQKEDAKRRKEIEKEDRKTMILEKRKAYQRELAKQKGFWKKIMFRICVREVEVPLHSGNIKYNPDGWPKITRRRLSPY